MLVRMGEYVDIYSLLVKVQTGIPATEINVDVSQEVQSQPTIRYNYSTLGQILQ